MSLLDYFRPVSTWTADQLREFLDRHGPEEYTLIDVRQPTEYRNNFV